MTCRIPLTITASSGRLAACAALDLVLCLLALYSPGMLVNVELSAGNINRGARIFSISAHVFALRYSPFVHDEMRVKQA
jgi:hypothetical protein